MDDNDPILMDDTGLILTDDNTDPCVLVEGPKWCDAKFYGEWLLAAAFAQSLWKQALKDDQFKKRVDRICICVIHNFGISATRLLMKLREDKTRFVFPVDRDEDGEAFAMMVEMGFFVRKDRSYLMTIPSSLTGKKVKAAVIKLVKTEDDEHVIHVEHLVTVMPFAEATGLHCRLRAVDEFLSYAGPVGTCN